MGEAVHAQASAHVDEASHPITGRGVFIQWRAVIVSRDDQQSQG